jgi:hypothetical protein
MQVDSSNPMTGIQGRATLLSNLAKALGTNSNFFGADARPGNLLGELPHLRISASSDCYIAQPIHLIDFLHSESLPSESPDHKTRIHISALWTVLIEGLAPIWPQSRTQLGGVSLGDVWPCSALAKASTSKKASSEGDDLVPFHKLSQWLAYSLIEAIEKVLKWKVEGSEDLTGLPEYRNGGLLVDFGVLSLRSGAIPQTFYPDPSNIPRLPPSHPAIIEWRAMTVIEL